MKTKGTTGTDGVGILLVLDLCLESINVGAVTVLSSPHVQEQISHDVVSSLSHAPSLSILNFRILRRMRFERSANVQLDLDERG